MNTPKIRFKGFTDDWEQRKLGDVCSRVQGNDGRMELPTLTISAGNGWMRQEDRFSGNIAGKEQKNYTLLRKGELSYNHGNSKLAKYGTVFSLQTYEEALVPRVYHSFKVKEGNCDFVEYYFATKLPDRELSKLISSGARMDGLLNIGYDEFMGIQMKFPSTLEQRKISLYFRKLDHLITLHQRKCDETKELKKYMLQKMFPKDGEKNPEIRFEGFTDDWEQRKVLDLLVQPVTDGPHETPRLVENGIPFISVDAIVDNKIDFSRKRGDVSEEYDAECCKKYKPQYHDVYVVKSGSTVGKVAIVETTDRFNIWSPLAALRCEGKTKPYYLFYLLQTRRMQAQILDKASNGTQPNLSMRELEKFDVLVTDNAEEQQRIGDYFKSLDHLITLHQRKCEKLKELKKFMLQNMFV